MLIVTGCYAFMSFTEDYKLYGKRTVQLTDRYNDCVDRAEEIFTGTEIVSSFVTCVATWTKNWAVTCYIRAQRM